MLNRKCTICSTSKPFWAIRSVYKPVFHQYLPIGCAYSTHRLLELEIWRFSCRWQQQRQTDKPIALLLAHARGVIINYTIKNLINWGQLEWAPHKINGIRRYTKGLYYNEYTVQPLVSLLCCFSIVITNLYSCITRRGVQIYNVAYHHEYWSIQN